MARGWGLLLTGLIGAVNIPFYEEMALRDNWWRYANCRMLLHTPYYIIVGEFLIAVAIGVLARWTRSGRWSRSLAAGVLAGLATLPLLCRRVLGDRGSVVTRRTGMQRAPFRDGVRSP